MEKKSFNLCHTNLHLQLDKIVIELHNMGRTVENFKGSPPGLTKSLRLLGNSASDLKVAIYKIDLAVDLRNI